MAIVATGGYGRGLLAPYSDVDLLFVLPYKQTPWGESVVEYVLYMLWDLGLKVGHATRTVEQSHQAGARRHDDPHRAARCAPDPGRRSLFDELMRRFRREVVQRDGARSSWRPSSPSATSGIGARANRATGSSPTSRTAKAACATCIRCTGSPNTSTATA